MLTEIQSVEASVRPAEAVVHQQQRSVAPAEPSAAPMDGGIAAERLIERVTGWPDQTQALIEHAKWLASTGGDDALATAGVVEISKRVVYRPDSPVACRMTRQMLVGCGGLRFSDQLQNVWYVCQNSPATDGPNYLAISMGPDSVPFRPQSVGHLTMKSVDVLSVLRGQNVLAAIELLIWLVQSRSRLKSWSCFGSSPLEMLAAIGRRRQTSREDVFADFDDIVSVIHRIRVREMRLLPNSWQFVTAREQMAARILREKNVASVEPSDFLPAVLHAILPELGGA